MSKRIVRRSIAALLAAVMMFTVVPVSTSAAGAEVADATDEVLYEASDESRTEAEGEVPEEKMPKSEEGSEYETGQTGEQTETETVSENETGASEDSAEVTETEDDAEETIEELESENESVIEEETTEDGIALYAASDFTQSQAVDWINNQINKPIGSGECVDLISSYLNYLGLARISGNAIEYASKNPPAGWQAINGASIQAGDIVIWTNSPNGHVALAVSDSEVVEQNYKSIRICTKNPMVRPGFDRYQTGDYWGVWRPNFKDIAFEHNPIGVLDSVTGGAGSITVRGWAFDYDDPSQSLDIHVYIGGPCDSGAPGYPIKADQSRPDVGDAYGAGNYHGFKETITTEKTGVQDVYVYAINVGEGDNSLIEQGTVTITDRVKGSYMETGYERTIPDGYYHIVSSFGDKWWLTIEKSSTADGGNVEVADYSGKDFECDEQLFYFKFIDDGGGKGFYKITNKKSGKCLSVAGGSEYMYDENGSPTNVIQWVDNGTPEQRWAVREVDGGESGRLYTFKARVSGFCLDLFGWEDGLDKDMKNISIYEDKGGPAQLWRLIPYVPPKMDPPTASIPSGSVVEGGTRIFLDGGGADKIYFTWDGSDPRTSPNRYSYYGQFFDRSGIAAFNSWETMTIKAYAVKEGYQDSDVAEFTYIVAGNTQPEKGKLNLPTASIPSGTEVEAGTEVSLLSGVDGAAIYYTLDGTNPSQKSIHYSRPFIIEKDTLITACVVKDGFEDSDPAVFNYTVKSRDNYGKGDVLDEDIPLGKVENIPQGLWMSAVSSQVYTGKAIKPQVRVYDYKTLLTEKKDYTISYKNNIKANIVSGVNVPTITVTGKGNYTGKEVQTFVIRPKRLSDVDIMADDITLQYNGKVQKTLPVLTWNGKKLARNKDYAVSYPDEESDGMADPMAYSKSGTYTVLVKGMGNYTGEKTINLTITQSKSASTMTIAKIADHTYTGSEVRPVPVVKSGKVVLTEGEDYEVFYQNNINVGTATVLINGKGDYVGVKKALFKIVPKAALNKARAEMEFDNPAVYTGRAVRPDRYRLTVSEKNADGINVTVTLTEGVDYEVSYRNNNKAGTATVIFQGINGYSGTLKKTYKIAPYDIGKDEADQKIRIELADSYMYVKGGCKPEPVVTYQGKVLTKGTDYTLSYKNNNGLNDGSNPRKQPIVIVKGKGCFKGTREKTYRITSKGIDRAAMTAVDRVWQNKGNIYKTKVVIKDEDGKALNAGKDYDSALTYEYNSNTVLPDGTLREAGEHVAAQDIIPAGTVIRVTAAAKGSNYFGTVSCVYRITKADIGKAVVTIPAQTYTGRAIMPENEIRIKLNGQILPEENYQITGYSNNINKGTATVTISGINDCGGTKTAKFKIKGKGVLWWWR